MVMMEVRRGGRSGQGYSEKTREEWADSSALPVSRTVGGLISHMRRIRTFARAARGKGPALPAWMSPFGGVEPPFPIGGDATPVRGGRRLK
jgi:hypothetical protein